MPESLLAIAVRRGGVLKGARAAEVILSWAMAEMELGHELGAGDGGQSAAIREYAAHWKVSERTAWRDLRRFRAVFPEEESPARLARIVAREAGDLLSRDRTDLLTTPMAFA